MRSHYSTSLNLNCISSLKVLSNCSSRCSAGSARLVFTPPWICGFDSFHGLKYAKLNGTNVRRYGCCLRQSFVQLRAADEDSGGISTLDDWGENESTAAYVLSSSDGEDTDADFVLNPITDIDLPTVKVSSDEALTVTAHRLAMLGRGRKKHRIKKGVLINLGLITFLTVLLLFVDWCSWRIVRLPLSPFYLSRPFFISAILVSFVGYICVPLLDGLRMYQIIRNEGPIGHSLKKRTPTMGGLFFVPIGVTVAKVLAGFSSIEVSGAAIATLAFAAIGLLDDFLRLVKNKNCSLSAWLKILLEVTVAAMFSFWFNSARISSPYSMYIFL